MLGHAATLNYNLLIFLILLSVLKVKVELSKINTKNFQSSTKTKCKKTPTSPKLGGFSKHGCYILDLNVATIEHIDNFSDDNWKNSKSLTL